VAEKSPVVSDRRDFGAFCNFHQVKYAVEVGVDRGGFAKQFLDQWRGSLYYLVDNYAPLGSWAWDREPDFRSCQLWLTHHLQRVRFLKMDSHQAPAHIQRNHPLRFIYIDGDHSFGGVTADLKVWWPKLEQGGILAGHDWHKESVRTAVEQFAKDRPVFFTHEKTDPSWYMFKE
jgi:hypothetical protein